MCPTSSHKKTTFSVETTQLGSQVYRFDLNGLFSSAAYLTLYQRVRQVSIEAKSKQVFIILNFSSFNCVSENTNDFIEDKSQAFLNIVYIKYGLSNMSRTIAKSFIPKAKQSKIFEVKDEIAALALIRSIRVKQEGEEILLTKVPQLFVKKEYKVLNRTYKLYHHNEWVYESDNHEYSYFIDLIDNNIFVSTVIGNSEYRDFKNSEELFESVLLNILPESMNYYMIQDYSRLLNSSNRAQNRLIEFISQHADNIKLIVFFGLNRYLRAMIIIGRIFFSKIDKIVVVNSFDDAIDLVIEHKYKAVK